MSKVDEGGPRTKTCESGPGEPLQHSQLWPAQAHKSRLQVPHTPDGLTLSRPTCHQGSDTAPGWAEIWPGLQGSRDPVDAALPRSVEWPRYIAALGAPLQVCLSGASRSEIQIVGNSRRRTQADLAQGGSLLVLSTHWRYLAEAMTV